MGLKEVVAAAILGFLAVAVAGWLVSFLRNPYRSLGRGKATGAAGGVLQELDRLLARPSVEHKIEVEQKIQKRDDDVGGE
jgi:hypothetical protein